MISTFLVLGSGSTSHSSWRDGPMPLVELWTRNRSTTEYVTPSLFKTYSDISYAHESKTSFEQFTQKDYVFELWRSTTNHKIEADVLDRHYWPVFQSRYMCHSKHIPAFNVSLHTVNDSSTIFLIKS